MTALSESDQILEDLVKNSIIDQFLSYFKYGLKLNFELNF